MLSSDNDGYNLRYRRSLSRSPVPTKRSGGDDNIEYQSEESEESETASEVSESGVTSSKKHTVNEFYRTVTRIYPDLNETETCTRIRTTPDVAVVNAPSFSNINLALTVAVVVLALFYMLLLGRASEERQLSEESLRAKLVDYEKRLAESASKFDTLSDEEFGMLLFLGRQWITMKQKSPAFLVIVGARSEELAIAISDVFRASFMDVEPLTTFNLTSESSRVELHNQISRAAASAVPFAVLNGIDHLYWDAPLVLHALADYSSSEYCNALLLLTITKDFPGTRKECEKSMMEYLTSRWIAGGGSDDSVSPILSRIMQFVICL